MSHSEPRVSVITAVHNCEDFIGSTIESVQAQTVGDWELICVDDASTDDSAQVVERFAADDDRIRLIRLESNLGRPAAVRNVALAHARGEFVAVLDADDIATPERLELSLRAFDEDPELGLLGGQHWVIDAAGKIRDRVERPGLSDAQFKAALGKTATIAHSSSMMRRALVEAVGGYDERFPAVEDYDLFLRISPLCRCLRLDRCLLHYRRREGQLSETKAFASTLYKDLALSRARARAEGREFDEDAAFERVRRHVEGRQGLSRRAGLNLRAVAIRALQAGERDRFRLLIRRSVAYWPFSPHTLFWWLIGFMPASVQGRCAELWSRLRRHP